MVHVASHASFGFTDEYCCDGGYRAIPPILYSPEACNNDLANQAGRDCQSFTDADGDTWWRSEDDNCDIMACSGSAVREYGPADWVVVEDVLRGIGSPLLSFPNVIATPHIGGNTLEVAAHQGATVVADLARMLKGERPFNIMNPETLQGFT